VQVEEAIRTVQTQRTSEYDTSSPFMQNKTPLDLEKQYSHSLNGVLLTGSSYYPVRFAKKLAKQTVLVKPSAVYNKLKQIQKVKTPWQNITFKE
jgi:hypothetical protein